MRTITVYRIDKDLGGKVRLGTLMERRKTDRGNNLAGLLRLASDRFKSSSDQTIQIEFGGVLLTIS